MNIKLPETPCPRCEATQRFKPKKRHLPGLHSFGIEPIEVYIKCNICNYSKVVRISSILIEQLREERRKILRAIRNHHEQFGVVPPHLQDHLICIQQQLIQAQENLKKELDDINPTPA